MKSISEPKALLLTIAAGVASYLEPIANNVFAMTYLLFINFIVGLLVSLLIQREDFSWRKMGWCGVEAMIFFILVASIYIVGNANGNQDGAVQCVSMTVYAMCYFYSVRILRNLCTIFPTGNTAWKILYFIYTVLTLEIAKHIPGLEGYLKSTERMDTQTA